MQLAQGVPVLAWQFPICDIAVVWSKLGAASLLEHGWQDKYILAKNPSIPSAKVLQDARSARRRQLGFQETDFCVLFLGQILADGTILIPGYRETCETVGEGVSFAMKTSHLVFMLRPHYSEKTSDTEQILHESGLDSIVVSYEKSLAMDIAAADLVISMHSGALEEAYLMGKPIVQVVSLDFPLPLDFRHIDAPLVRTPQDLANLLVNREWMMTCKLPNYPSVADEIVVLLEENKEKGFDENTF
jgi:hypothetical protein